MACEIVLRPEVQLSSPALSRPAARLRGLTATLGRAFGIHAVRRRNAIT